jgi:hypothetical protein
VRDNVSRLMKDAMPIEPTEAEIAKAVREALHDDLVGLKIVDVSVLGRTERDDGPTVRIQVTCEGRPKDWDARVLSSAVRHVRPKLVEIGEFAFPLFSFVTVSDAGHRHRASA